MAHLHALIGYFFRVLSLTYGAAPFQQLLMQIVCGHLLGDKPFETCAADSSVQAASARWLLAMNVAEQLAALAVLTVAGTIIDLLGCRTAMILSATASLVQSIVFLLVALAPSRFPLAAVVFTNVLCGFLGTIVTFKMAASAFLTRTTHIEHRTRYFLYLDAVQAIAIVGPFLGGTVTKLFGFVVTFGVMVAISSVMMLHLIFLFPNVDVSENSPLNASLSVKSLQSAFLESIGATKASIQLVFKYRSATSLLAALTILGFLLPTAQVFFVFYPSKIWGWTSFEFGKFALFANLQKVAWLSLILPWILSFARNRGDDKLGWEIFVLRASLAFTTLGEFCYGTVSTDTAFTLCTLLASMSCFGIPTIRSLLSTLVAPSHQGRLFGGIQIFENVASLMAMIGFSYLYQLTVDTAVPQAIFLVMGTALLVAFFTVLFGVNLGGVVRMGQDSALDEGNRFTEDSPLIQ